MSEYFHRLQLQLNQMIDWSNPQQYMILVAIVVLVGFFCLRGKVLKTN